MPIALPNESAEYRAARDTLLAAEADLRSRVEDVAALRRTLPKGGQIPQDYAFRDLGGNIAPISSLFGDHDTLVVYSLMFGPKAQDPCPMCSAFLDGLTGQVAHLTRKTAFAVVAQNTPDALAALSRRMGWQDLPLYSALDTTYQKDYLAETEDGNQLPILNVFQRDAEGLHHFWSSELFFQPSDWHPRHVDAAWPLWNILDLTPQGRGDFVPPLR